jgi:ZIP family zinc transporter
MKAESMLETFISFHPSLQALLATVFTWGLTALGAAGVFLWKEVNHKLLHGMLGFAAGVMIAASYWSLLAPAIRLAEDGPLPPWLPAAIGFLAGGLFLGLIDRILPHLHLETRLENAEGIQTNWKRSVLLMLAITLHNIPEGLAVGVAFGAAALGIPEATIGGAIALALGIGIQNFPEGLAVSLPMRKDGISRFKSFFYGQASALVEPVAALIGAATVLFARSGLPYALSFAAGAMIFVVVEELIPESQTGGHSDIATLGVMIGFTVMMLLDVALG